MNRFISASLLATISFLISCNDDDKEPDYPIEPYIEFADIKFIEGSGAFKDSLILNFHFRDGDMDLGLDEDMPSDYDFPYHPINYFLENNGGLSMVTTTKQIGYPPFLNVPSDQHGKLVTVRTRGKDGYHFLPEFNCYNYNFDSVYVLESNKEIFDESYNLIRSTSNPEGYQLLDTFYYEMNENYFNILVDFLVKQPDGSFTQYDLQKETCDPVGFNGRFQRITGIKKGIVSKSGPFKIKGYSSKDGALQYDMESTGLRIVFASKTIKLRIKIKDRALHDSNVIESNEILIN